MNQIYKMCMAIDEGSNNIWTDRNFTCLNRNGGGNIADFYFYFFQFCPNVICIIEPFRGKTLTR